MDILIKYNKIQENALIFNKNKKYFSKIYKLVYKQNKEDNMV